MHKTIIDKHRDREESKAKMFAIGSQIGVIRGNNGCIKKTGHSQARCPQNDWINQVDHIWTKLAQTTQKQWTEQIKFQFRIKRERQSNRANHLRSGIFRDPAFRTKQEHTMPISL